jgi:hypothetical protein
MLGGVGTFGRDLDDFNRVLCPKCGHEFSCEAVKIFGIFNRQLAWVPLAIVLMAALLLLGYRHLGG